jgi:TraY domain
MTMAEENQSKRVQISVHLDELLREQLEAAAKRAVRSLSGEAAYRIRQSLESERNAV